MFRCLGMVSTNLCVLFYAGETQNNGNVFFLESWVRFARANKAVALQRNTTSEAETPTYVEVLPSSLSVDEHKHSPA